MNQYGAPSALKPHRGTMLIIFGVLGLPASHLVV